MPGSVGWQSLIVVYHLYNQCKDSGCFYTDNTTYGMISRSPAVRELGPPVSFCYKVQLNLSFPSLKISMCSLTGIWLIAYIKY